MAAKAAAAALTRTVTGAVLAPYETQRRMVSGKTGTYSSASPEKSMCVSIDPGGEMMAPVFGDQHVWLRSTFICGSGHSTRSV